MYQVDGDDRVIELGGIPQSSVGAPCPMVVAGEHALAVCFYLQNESEWDGKSIRVVDPTSSTDTAAVVWFLGPTAHMFGPPNDEAFSGHPLAARGLEPYGAYEIQSSSWIRRLEHMNSVHPYHRAAAYDRLRHFVLSFHDTTFECVARDFSVEVVSGPISAAAARMANRM